MPSKLCVNVCEHVCTPLCLCAYVQSLVSRFRISNIIDHQEFVNMKTPSSIRYHRISGFFIIIILHLVSMAKYMKNHCSKETVPYTFLHKSVNSVSACQSTKID